MAKGGCADEAEVLIAANAFAGSGLTVRYAWNAALDAACTTGMATSSGAVLTAPAGDNTLYLCAKDNTGRVGQWNGRYRIASPLSLPVCGVSPTTAPMASGTLGNSPSVTTSWASWLPISVGTRPG